MKINTYKQGKRLVVVFDNLEETTETELIIKFLSSIAETRVVESPETDEVAVEKESCPTEYFCVEEECAEGEMEAFEEMEALEAQFIDGPYKGKTPKETLSGSSKEIKNAYIYLTKNLGEFGGKLLEATKKAISEFVDEMFLDVNPDDYAAQLTKGQQKTFLKMYSYSISEKAKQKICEANNETNWENLINNENDKREIVKKIITMFQK